jgi:FtsP/CotA-like multicopper oxidase with cupredoxin domain
MKTIAAGLATLATLTFTVVPAAADAPTGHGSVGWTNALVQGHPISIESIATCSVGGVSSASTDGAAATGFVTYGKGKSTCDIDTTGATKVTVTGNKFRFDGLKTYGGPVIKVKSFSVSCNTVENGSQASITITGLSGFTVPNPIPANHTVTIPSAQPGSQPIARVVLNEMIVPDPPDGSMTLNLMHVTLFPEGVSIDSGEVVLGSVSCSPDADRDAG